MTKIKRPPGSVPLTDFGVQVTTFCAKNCITKKALCAAAGIRYMTLMSVTKGNRGDAAVRAILEPFMANYSANQTLRGDSA